MTAKQTPQRQQPLKTTRAGESIANILRVLEKRVQRTRAGKPYLALKLGDKSGNLPARIWEEAEHYGDLFELGDFVFVQGLAETFNGTLQLRVTHLERVSSEAVNPADFERTSPFDPTRMLEELGSLIEARVNRAEVRRFLLAILDAREVRERMLKAPAAKGNHHAYVAGLLEHTLSMVRLAVAVADHYQAYYPGLVNGDLLVAGAFLHDIGKLWELSPGLGIDYTDEGRLVGHVVIGVELITRTLDRLEIRDAELTLRLKHLVLSHHGELEFGAAVMPQTPEAQLLHYIDQIDARMNMFAEAMSEGDERWSRFVRPLGRFVFSGERAESEAAKEPEIAGSSPPRETVVEAGAKATEPIEACPPTARPEEPPGWEEPPFHLYEEDSHRDEVESSLDDSSTDAAESLEQAVEPGAGPPETTIEYDEEPFVDRLTLDLFDKT